MIDIAESITHCLAAISFQCIVGFLSGYSAISIGIFIAGIIAILINLDHLDLPQKRTPYTHSIFFSIIWTTIISIIAYNIYVEWFEIILATISGFVTHLIMDYFTDEGIFLTLKKFDLKPLHRGDNKMWHFWVRIGSVRKLKSYDFKLNVSISTLSILTILVCVILN